MTTATGSIARLRPPAGRHPERTSLVTALGVAGVINPLTGKPFPESWVLGLGGGLGVGYILWEFKADHSAVLVLAFGYRWNYVTEHATNAVQRAGGDITILETGGAKTAAAHLAETLDQGLVAVCPVDQYHLPHLQLPASFDGCFGWTVTVIDQKGGVVKFHDIGKNVRSMDAQLLALARGRIGSYKHRLMRVQADKPMDAGAMKVSVREALSDCCDYLGARSDSFALPAIRKWARLMTDTRNAKAWPSVFNNGERLFGVLRSIHSGIRYDAAGGGGMRDLYSDFLAEAGQALERDELQAAAAAYRKCARAWDAVADCALTGDDFGAARRALRRRYQLITTGSDETHDAEAANALDLQRINDEMRADFPLDRPAQLERFAELQHNLQEVLTCEESALEALRSGRDSL